MKQFIFSAAVLLISTFAFSQPEIQLKAPEISLPDQKGVSVKLSSLQGKIVLIDFWASWCGPCRESMKGLRELYKKYKDKGFEIYGISVDENKNYWRQAIFDEGMKWLQVIDAEGKIAAQWNVQYIPDTFLLDKNGNMIAVNSSKEELDKLLKKLLG
ncbi:MAG: peroxiredoxin family protein [Chitinophagaceae bacterium]